MLHPGRHKYIPVGLALASMPATPVLQHVDYPMTLLSRTRNYEYDMPFNWSGIMGPKDRCWPMPFLIGFHPGTGG
jgi:hypothetical protein